jgi:hypothetical protein
MKKILIVGDSFSSNSLAGEYGWTTLLANSYQVTNVSSPGIGQYKILKKIEKQNLSRFDQIIISHTSPNRVYCKENLLYPPGHVYRNSDLIFADIENKQKNSNLAKSIFDYFCQIFDEDYYKFIHNQCCKEINHLTKNYKVMHITNFNWEGLYEFDNMLNFYNLWLNNRGSYNHYNQYANQVIFQTILDSIK